MNNIAEHLKAGSVVKYFYWAVVLTNFEINYSQHFLNKSNSHKSKAYRYKLTKSIFFCFLLFFPYKSKFDFYIEVISSVPMNST